MYEPGPPRTTSVGESVELAPRSPDPDETYRWRVRDAPAESALSAGDGPDPDATGPPSSATAVGSDDSTATTGSNGSAATTESDGSVTVLRAGETSRDDDPVVHLVPDAPGTYVLALDAPDGVHRQRVRAFPDERREAEIRVPADDLSVEDGEVDRVSLLWPHNENRLALDRAERDGDEWIASVRVPPGRHGFGFVPNDDRSVAYHGDCEVPGPGRPRVSLDATVVETDGPEGPDRLCLTAAVEPAPAVDEIERGGDADALDATFLVDDRDADPEAVAAIESRADGRTISVPLDELRGDGVDDAVRLHAVPHGERYGAAETVRIETGVDSDGADAETLAVGDPHATPDWAASPTVYEVFVRSFAGDTPTTTFREIERRIEYLDHLGVDALWLTPVLASPTDHGYHVTDYDDTASDLGSRESFESLVDACHDAGIRVVFDLVINHTSRDHPAFQLHSAGVDAYADHYRRTDATADVTGIDWAKLGDGDAPDYYFEWGRIPNLNYDSPAVREWLLDVVDEWAGVVDGFRADVAWGVPHGFWKEVADRVPDDVLLLDETLPHDPFYGEGEFHRHYDTSLYETLRAVGAGEEPADAVETALARGEWLGFGADGRSQMRYVENHDEDRYLAEYGRDALRAAAAVTFTLPGAPMIYAGQERGNETYRGPVRWHDGDNDLTEFHRRLAALRESEPVLRDGEVSFDGRAADVRVIEGDAERVTAYERTPREETEPGGAGRDEPDGDDALLVVVNFAEAPATVAVPDSVDADLFGDASIRGADGSDDDGGGESRVAVDAVAVLR